MSKKGSSLIEDKYVPMIGCFVAGFVVNRLMNHQDVVTGDVKEGVDDGWRITFGIPATIAIGILFLWIYDKVLGDERTPLDGTLADGNMWMIPKFARWKGVGAAIGKVVLGLVFILVTSYLSGVAYFDAPLNLLDWFK